MKMSSIDIGNDRVQANFNIPSIYTSSDRVLAKWIFIVKLNSSSIEMFEKSSKSEYA
jgi:hypothetical protein